MGSAGREAVVKLGGRAYVGAGPEEVGLLEKFWGAGRGGGLSPNPTPASFPLVTRVLSPQPQGRIDSM